MACCVCEAQPDTHYGTPYGRGVPYGPVPLLVPRESSRDIEYVMPDVRKRPHPVRQCLWCVLTVFLVIIVGYFAILDVLVIWIRLTPRPTPVQLPMDGGRGASAPAPVCAIRDYDLADLLTGTALTIGTKENVIGSYFDPATNFDLTGLWWLNWEDTPLLNIYEGSRAEVVISFAGSTFDTPNATFPNSMRLPGAGRNHLWGYGNTWFALWTMQWHAFTWCATCQSQSLQFAWTNRTFAYLVGFDNFIKEDEDRWLRPNVGGNFNYHLTRVVYANGTKNAKWWPEFEQFMSGFKVRTWDDISDCKRKCEVFFQVIFFPVSVGCEVCTRYCS